MNDLSEETFKELMREIISRINRMWFLRFFFELLPIAFTFLISFSPIQRVFLTDDGGGLNNYGIFVIVAMIFCIVLNLMANYISSHDNMDKNSYEAENQIRCTVSVHEDEYEEGKNRILRDGYKQIAYDNNNLKDFIIHYINPKERTSKILTQIGNCMAEECDGIKANEIVLSAIVLDEKGEWKWLCPPAFEGMASKEDLIQKSSALRQVIEKQTFYYNNDKEQAIKANQYIPDRRDVTNNKKGSIICWEVATEIESEKNNEKYLFRMIISISTYGKKLIESNRKKEDIDWIYKEVFEKIILNLNYSRRLKKQKRPSPKCRFRPFPMTTCGECPQKKGHYPRGMFLSSYETVNVH